MWISALLFSELRSELKEKAQKKAQLFSPQEPTSELNENRPEADPPRLPGLAFAGVNVLTGLSWSSTISHFFQEMATLASNHTRCGREGELCTPGRPGVLSVMDKTWLAVLSVMV